MTYGKSVKNIAVYDGWFGWDKSRMGAVARGRAGVDGRSILPPDRQKPQRLLFGPSGRVGEARDRIFKGVRAAES